MEAHYDPLRKEKKAHGDLNKLRTRLAGHHTSIAKLPSHEASFAEKCKSAILTNKDIHVSLHCKTTNWFITTTQVEN